MKHLIWLPMIWVLAGATPAYASETPELPPLTTVPNSPRLTGKFVWADLVTDDVPATRKFYSQLFGWTFSEAGNYTLAANDERPLAGMLQRARPAGSSARPRWIPYMSVSSVSESQAQVTKSGGKVLARQHNYPKRGDQAVFADPEGAVFGVIASRRGDPPDFLPEPGDWIWVQLFTREVARASEFYRKFGDYEVLPNTERTNSVILTANGYARAAVMGLPADKPQVRPAWLPFVRVKHITESLQQAKTLGGQVLIAPKDDLLQGRVAVIADPTGAAIGMMEWKDEEPVEGQP